jgi:broad specificity phosphatase PhoE
MLRAKETAQIAFPYAEIITDPRIREYFAGNDWESSYGEFEKEEAATLRMQGFRTGETYQQQIDRVYEFILERAKEHSDGKIAAVSHL